MVRTLLWASLGLAPVTILVDKLTGAGHVALFVLAAVALIPLAWLIGEATEHAAEHTGPGIGGFLNASFGNAPELIVALFAVGANLPVVVRGSLSGSVISNLLLVYGVTQVAGPDGARIDRRSLLVQLGLVGAAVVAFVVPTTIGYTGRSERHAVVVASIPVAIVLLLGYLAVVGPNLLRHREDSREREPGEGAWSLTTALAALALATGATAWVSEILVGSLASFATAVGLSQFFIAVVIVAIVGNAAEHGGAILIARNGKMRLATEIAISSSAQVALLVIPVVTLLSLLFSHQLALAFRWTEVVAMAGAAIVVAATVWDGRSHRREGMLLVAAYAAAVLGFLFGGGR
ncbi:MAG TPA: calcium/proton exchanger [Gaiellaceae bacterium]|nr:calcium/proton exchanger [Gaiellaceae bacterium]HKU55779.1 calcium/proton exchanger [Gaiellaceae bacterium]